MTARGPGGRLPSDQAGRPVQGQGVGASANRSDLSKTPGQRDSDLQQGDTQAFEQGQRIQPIKEQRPAAPSRAGTPVRPAGPEGQQPNITDIAKARLGGTLGQDSSRIPPDRKLEALERSWGTFLKQLAKDPQVSPLFRARAQITVRALAERGAYARSSYHDMNEVDDEIDQFLSDQGF